MTESNPNDAVAKAQLGLCLVYGGGIVALQRLDQRAVEGSGLGCGVQLFQSKAQRGSLTGTPGLAQPRLHLRMTEKC